MQPLLLFLHSRMVCVNGCGIVCSNHLLFSWRWFFPFLLPTTLNYHQIQTTVYTSIGLESISFPTFIDVTYSSLPSSHMDSWSCLPAGRTASFLAPLTVCILLKKQPPETPEIDSHSVEGQKSDLSVIYRVGSFLGTLREKLLHLSLWWLLAIHGCGSITPVSACLTDMAFSLHPVCIP